MRVFEPFSGDLHVIFPLYFFFNPFLVLWIAVSFLLLLWSYKENIGSSDKIMKPEEFLEETILICYIRAFSFCFLCKSSQQSSCKHLFFEEKYIIKTFYLKMMLSKYLLRVHHRRYIELGALRHMRE